MERTVFYAWQSDLDEKIGKRFVGKALDKAIKRLNAGIKAEEALRSQQDTTGIPGSPDLAATIFRRIESALAFVGDISIASNSETRPFPNPNVLIEYGWALAKLGDQRVITVFNEAFGDWERDRPFDMRHKRKPCLYRLSATQSAEEKQSELDKLISQLESQLKAILREVAQTVPSPPLDPPAFQAFNFARADCVALRPRNHEHGRMPNFWIGAVPVGLTGDIGRISQVKDIWPGRTTLHTSAGDFETIDHATVQSRSEIVPVKDGAAQTWTTRAATDGSHREFVDHIARLVVRKDATISLCVKTSQINPEPHLNVRWIMSEVANMLRTIDAVRSSLSLTIDYYIALQLRYDDHHVPVGPVRSGTWRLTQMDDETGIIGPLVDADPVDLGPYIVGQQATRTGFLWDIFADLHEAAERLAPSVSFEFV